MARRVRIHGGYTVFYWQNQVIGFADQVTVTGVTPVVPQPKAIQPLNYLRPAEIITPRASSYGVITLRLTELWNEAVWQRLAGLANSRDIIDIFESVAADQNGIQIRKYVRTPGNAADYYETFFNCVIASVEDGEDVRIDTMEVNKAIEVWYTHSLKNYPRIPNTARPGFFT
jgi:hypothetical protein